ETGPSRSAAHSPGKCRRQSRSAPLSPAETRRGPRLAPGLAAFAHVEREVMRLMHHPLPRIEPMRVCAPDARHQAQLAAAMLPGLLNQPVEKLATVAFRSVRASGDEILDLQILPGVQPFRHP